MNETPEPPLFSVVVPTRGAPDRLTPFLDAIDRQTLPRSRWELVVAADGASLGPDLAARVGRANGRCVGSAVRLGPGAARNHGAAVATGTFLAFTEDDCSPAADWLARAAVALAASPSADVLVGATTKPGGRPVRRRAESEPDFLPTNLFVRRDAFARSGGYVEAYYDAETGAYFREDSDFGFALEALDAQVIVAPDVRVEHPDEHPSFLDPLRWAARYEMDPLLAARYPNRFRDRIEVHRLGPFRIRRPVVRACFIYLIALAAAAVTSIANGLVNGGLLLGIAALALLPVWAKWGFDPRRLPVVPLVPFVLAGALARGRLRLARLGAVAREAAIEPAGSGGRTADRRP